MNVSYVNPFIAATVNVFKTMLATDIRPGKPHLKSVPHPTFDVSGIIGLSGSAQGSIAISFPKPMALRIVSKMLGIEIKIIGPDLTDGIGELANIIAGNAKQDLEQYQLSISLPNVIVGKDHIVAGQSGIPAIVVPFASNMGDFVMEVTLKS